MKIKTIWLVLIIVVSVMLLSACGQKTPTAAPGSGTTTIDAQAVLNSQCTACHSLSKVTSTHATAEQWKAIVERMVNNGAVLTSQEQDALVQYLAEHYQ
jgi:predicted small lipoprotein YifL